VRKYFKEATTTKCLLALPTAARAHTVLTFSIGATCHLLEVAPTLPLRTLNIILNGSTMVTGILESGCQVVIIHRDIWERLGDGISHLTLTDPNTGASIMVPTQAREPAPRKHHHSCPSKEDFY